MKDVIISAKRSKENSDAMFYVTVGGNRILRDYISIASVENMINRTIGEYLRKGYHVVEPYPDWNVTLKDEFVLRVLMVHE